MQPRFVDDFLRNSAAAHPSRIAVADATGQTIAYDELNRRSDGFAAFLASRGVRRGDRVGVVMPKSIEALVAVFGIMKAGAAYVPVDSTGPVDRGSRILSDCAISALVVEDRLRDAYTKAVETTLRAIVTAGEGSPLVMESATPFDAPGRDASDLAYIIFTSGSTGAPKGAMIAHANALAFIDWCSSTFTPTPQDRVSSHAPLHFDYSVLDLFMTIKHGASVHLVSEGLARNGRELAQFIADRKLTIWNSTPSALMMLLQFGGLDTQDASSLRIVTFGGEIFPVKYLRQLKKHWPAPTYFNLYGPTEITTACTYARVPQTVPEERESPYPIGFACSHCRTLVLDENGREVAPGGEGLLYISGPSVFAGYWNRPAETASALLERNGVRWYNTGDIVRWDAAEGFTYVGRNDRMVKRRGFRIELGEIESALYLHPSIREAAVLSVPDPQSGVRIIAVINCRTEGRKPTLVDLKTFCGSKLPGYMIPDRFEFRESLPRTSSDKVDYRELKQEVEVGHGR